MVSRRMARHVQVAQRIEEVSGIRPVTLLIASGIALIIAILMVTGIAASQLRHQALHTANGELARIDGVLAEASNRSLRTVDAQLAEVAGRLSPAATADAASFQEAAAAPVIRALLRSKLGGFPKIDAIGLIAANGELLDRAGAWPTAGIASGDFVAGLRAAPTRGSIVGAAIRDPQTGAVSIPLVRRIDGPAAIPVGALAGAVVAMIPAADFTTLFAAVPLAPDAVIALVRPDGSILARHTAQAGPANQSDKDRDLDASVFNGPAVTVVRDVTTDDGQWQIKALRSLADYPAAVVVSHGAALVLAEWAQQGLWFGAFALVGAVVIGIMVYLIARQFQTHADLAEMRTERIEAEKIEIERARLVAEAELLKSERLSVLGQLTATVAHELRNPLSAIRNTLFTVKELATTAGIKLDRPIGRMERSIERCDRIISDLLEYTRNRELNRTNIRFDRWLTDLLAEQSVAPPVVLATELSASEAVVLIDADRVRRVVINLVENAAQALAETAPDRDKRIAVRTSAVDGELVLVVEDTGPGIDPENLGRIFEPLFSTKSFGTGLGLPTVKQIVNQHGGIITVDSEIGRGTCVTVRLPLGAEALEEVKVAA